MTREQELERAAVVDSPRPRRRGFYDRLTRVMFRVPFMTGYFMYTLGPAVVLMRDEYGISRALASLHGTASAFGGITAALLAVRLVSRFGRRRVMLSSIAASAIGIGFLTFGNGIVFSLSGVLLSAVAGSLSVNSMTAVLSQHHGARASAVITQAHAILASMGLLAPAIMAAFVGFGLGWRPAFAVVWVFGLFIFIGVFRLPRHPELDNATGTAYRFGARRRPFRRGFWGLFAALIATAAAEHSTLYWAGDLLRERLAVTPATAALSVSFFVGGIFLGRIVFSRFATRHDPLMVVTIALPIALVGWAMLWATPWVASAFGGMLLIGVGVAPNFPMTVALMSALSNGQPDRSIALSSLGAGIATGIAPFVLAALSDLIGPIWGFLLVPTFLIAGLALLIVSLVRQRRERRRQDECAIVDPSE